MVALFVLIPMLMTFDSKVLIWRLYVKDPSLHSLFDDDGWKYSIREMFMF